MVVLQPNHVSGNAATIGGGINNFDQLAGATIGGGANNVAGFYGTVAGGNSNQANGEYSGVGGGQSNIAGGDHATVGGGQNNTTSNPPCALNLCANTIGGGSNNVASGALSTVGGGYRNTASDPTCDAINFYCGSTVGGGVFNTASGGVSTVAGGFNNIASGNSATVPGGSANDALGDNSFAVGVCAIANYAGSFVWSDDSTQTSCDTTSDAQDTGPEQFVARATGGFFFYTDTKGGGAVLPSGSGSWSSLSDRNAKSNFSPVDSSALLEKLMAMPISTWNYRSQADSIRHLGPTAQDFHAAFGIGEDDQHISTVDAEGVALASIQALYQTVTELKSQLDEKARQVEELRARLARLERSAGTR